MTKGANVAVPASVVRVEVGPTVIDELSVNLTQIEPQIETIVLAASADGGTFGQFRGLHTRVVAPAPFTPPTPPPYVPAPQPYAPAAQPSPPQPFSPPHQGPPLVAPSAAPPVNIAKVSLTKESPSVSLTKHDGCTDNSRDAVLAVLENVDGELVVRREGTFQAGRGK